MLTPDEPFRGAIPRFSDDPNVPRYLLPGEERVREIVRELLSRNEWAFREWSAALPKSSASLAGGRSATQGARQGRGGLAARPRDGRSSAARGGQTRRAHWPWRRGPKPSRSSRAGKTPSKQYRRAIELIDDETIKRSWWFNLADIELRLDDESQRQTALRAALAVSTSDDISRRATEIQRANNVRPPVRPIKAPGQIE